MSDDRKHLTSREVEKLLDTARSNRHAARDRCMLFLMCPHGLRVSEACALEMSELDADDRSLRVARLNRGLSTTHPLHTEELRLIRAWTAQRARMQPACRAFFVSQMRQPLHRRSASLIVNKYGERTGLALPAHPPIPRGAATRLIQDHLGHRDIRRTVIYTAANPARFERLWR